MPPTLSAAAFAVDGLSASALDDRLVGLVQSPGFVPAAFAVAFVAGAAHAVGPGHGKSLAAAYLVGSDGKVQRSVVPAISYHGQRSRYLERRVGPVGKGA